MVATRRGGERTGAWMRVARAAFWMIPRALSSTSFSSRLFALVKSCLMHYCLRTYPTSPPNSSLPLSVLTISTSDGTPSARTSTKNFRNALAASDLRSGSVVLHCHYVRLTKQLMSTLRATEVNEKRSPASPLRVISYC